MDEDFKVLIFLATIMFLAIGSITYMGHIKAQTVQDCLSRIEGIATKELIESCEKLGR